MKHADAELTAMLEETVPPVDLSRIGSFRAVIQKYQKQARGVYFFTTLKPVAF